MTDDGRQMTDDGRQMTEDRRPPFAFSATEGRQRLSILDCGL
jgi:hypothetical protein